MMLYSKFTCLDKSVFTVKSGADIHSQSPEVKGPIRERQCTCFYLCTRSCTTVLLLALLYKDQGLLVPSIQNEFSSESPALRSHLMDASKTAKDERPEIRTGGEGDQTEANCRELLGDERREEKIKDCQLLLEKWEER